MDTMRWPESWRERTLFAGWLIIGGLVGFGFLSLLSIGAFLLVAAALGGIVVLSVCGPSRGLLGAPVGLGAAALFIAWTNRGGPGTICVSSADAQTCTEQWSPWPWLAVAAVLIMAGIVGFRARNSGQGQRPRLTAPRDLPG